MGLVPAGEDSGDKLLYMNTFRIIQKLGLLRKQ